jgi:hypothetical protein
MTKFRWLFVILLALTLLGASGISPASAATATQPRDLTLASRSTVLPPTTGVLGGGSGGGTTDGDPDDIIEGNRLVAVADRSSTVTLSSAGAAVLLWIKVGGVTLLLRRLMP